MAEPRKYKRKTFNDPETLALGDNLRPPMVLPQTAPGVVSISPNALIKAHFHNMEAACLAMKQSGDLVAYYHASSANFKDCEPWKLHPDRVKLLHYREYFVDLRERLVEVHREHKCISGKLLDVLAFAFGPFQDKFNLRGISVRVSEEIDERQEEIWFNKDITEGL